MGESAPELRTVLSVHVSHQRQLIFLRKSDLPCLVSLFDLACFFLSSFSSLINNMYI